MSGAVRATLRPTAGLPPRELQAWRELAEAAVEANPFWHPDVLLPAARHLARGPVALLVAGDWAAALPVVRVAGRPELLLPALAGWRHDHCFLGTPLVAPGAGGAVAALARAPRTALVVPWIGTDGPVAEALRAAGAVEVAGRERAVVRRRSEPTYTDGRLSGSRRKKLRKAARTLAEELGGELEAADVSGEDAALDRFLALERSGWKGREGTALACDPAQERFVREACRGLRERGALQVLELRAGGRTAAMQVNFLAGDGLFCFKVAMDEALARHSPGTQLELWALEEFHRRTEIGWMDSCAAADAELLNRLWPDRRAIATAITGPRALVRPGLAAAQGARRARAALLSAAARRAR